MKNKAIKPAMGLFLLLTLSILFALTPMSALAIEKPCGKRSLFATSISQDEPCAGQPEKKPTKEDKDSSVEAKEGQKIRPAKFSKKTEDKKDVDNNEDGKKEQSDEDEDELKDPEKTGEKQTKEEDEKKTGQKKTEKEKAFFGMFVHEDPDPELSFTLKPFGAGVFAKDESVPENLPAPPDYPVGPGDEIGVTFWGRINGEYLVTVSNEGTIDIPVTGPIVVSGLTFKEVKELIIRKARSIVGAEASVTMGRLRSIQVFVFGEFQGSGLGHATERS